MRLGENSKRCAANLAPVIATWTRCCWAFTGGRGTCLYPPAAVSTAPTLDWRAFQRGIRARICGALQSFDRASSGPVRSRTGCIAFHHEPARYRGRPYLVDRVSHGCAQSKWRDLRRERNAICQPARDCDESDIRESQLSREAARDGIRDRFRG